jgi:hypothetical protein
MNRDGEVLLGVGVGRSDEDQRSGLDLRKLHMSQVNGVHGDSSKEKRDGASMTGAGGGFASANSATADSAHTTPMATKLLRGDR